MLVTTARRLLARSLSTSGRVVPPYSLKTGGDYVEFSDPGALEVLEHDDLLLDPCFLSEEEHDTLKAGCIQKLARLCRGPYVETHFDGVIRGYKECTVSSWALSSSPNTANTDDDKILRILERARQSLRTWTKNDIPFISPHILELREGNSGIGPHVDNVKASGNIVAGLCLISPAIIIFRRKDNPQQYIRALLPERSLYLQRNALRYSFTHEIPEDRSLHSFRGKEVLRGRRISIMFRDEMKKS
ncbi:Alpha-ketoglutarate-dependent dioxygenase alkB 7, mitochondrial [Quaeritorhiza haematococci]|nr:Alpha-ketoglutarate-dependent dioxygenase alkB 7, mitochondrial [Quaeritorhiza haematococci]